jgi:hypothetical protein
VPRSNYRSSYSPSQRIEELCLGTAGRGNFRATSVELTTRQDPPKVVPRQSSSTSRFEVKISIKIMTPERQIYIGEFAVCDRAAAA